MMGMNNKKYVAEEKHQETSAVELDKVKHNLYLCTYKRAAKIDIKALKNV